MSNSRRNPSTPQEEQQEGTDFMAIASEKERLNGAVVVSEFKGAVRDGNLNTLEPGDVFIIPSNFKVLEAPVNGSTRKAQFCLVDVIDVNGNKIAAKRFYPGSVQKNLAEVNDLCQPTGKRFSSQGTYASWFKKQTSIQGAVKASVGKQIKLVQNDQGQVRQFGTSDTTLTNFGTYDWVNPADEPQQG